MAWLVLNGLVRAFQKLLIYWDFHTQPSLGFTEIDQKKRKYPQVRGEWPYLFDLIRQQ